MEKIWLSPREYNCVLPRLFNSTRRRKRDISNFVAPDEMRNTVVRSIEFPNGVFINAYGEVKPDDPRSGVYQCKDVSLQRVNMVQTQETSETKEAVLPSPVDDDLGRTTKRKLIKRLKRGVDAADLDFKRQCRQRQASTSLRKYIDRVQELVDEWNSVRNPSIGMKYRSDSTLQVCDFTFKMPNRASVDVSFDMKEHAISCRSCGSTQTFHTIVQVYEHLVSKHTYTLTPDINSP